MKHRILFVTAEYDPLMKIGGLADVSAGLPAALKRLGHDVRVLLPAYGGLRGVRVDELPVVATWQGATLREWHDTNANVPLWLLDNARFRRRVHPYQSPNGDPWDDDAEAFLAFAHTAALLAAGMTAIEWHADIVHANEWHTGMAPVSLLQQRVRAASVFTIHNIAYQGLFPMETAHRLDIPAWLLHPETLEFHGRLSFMKAGLVFADRIAAVSPGYADEIQAAVFGAGLDGLMRKRRDELTGILNGIDTDAWNPATDASLPACFSADDLRGKAIVKASLLHELGFPADAATEPLLIFIGRLVEQKGVDLMLDALPRLLEQRLRLAILGSGDSHYENTLREVATRNADRIAVRIGYDAALARRLYAGGDMLLMPSRFEPCGLAQMYAMRYGCIPVAHAVGGLRDSIIDAGDGTTAADGATGFLFHAPQSDALLARVQQALRLYDADKQWRALMRQAMRRDFDWGRAAREYERVYDKALEKLNAR